MQKKKKKKLFVYTCEREREIENGSCCETDGLWLQGRETFISHVQQANTEEELTSKARMMSLTTLSWTSWRPISQAHTRARPWISAASGSSMSRDTKPAQDTAVFVVKLVQDTFSLGVHHAHTPTTHTSLHRHIYTRHIYSSRVLCSHLHKTNQSAWSCLHKTHSVFTS